MWLNLHGILDPFPQFEASKKRVFCSHILCSSTRGFSQNWLLYIYIYIYIYMEIENLMNPSIFWLSTRTYIFVKIWWFYIICLFWKYGEFGPWFFFPKIKIKIGEKNSFEWVQIYFILFYLVVKMVKSQKKPCSQYELSFGTFSPQFEVSQDNNFWGNLARFYKRREHPSKGEGEERNNVQWRREDHQCPTKRWQIWLCLVKAMMSKHLPMHLCGFYNDCW